MKFTIDGQVKEVLPIRVAGTFLLVEVSEMDSNGMQQKHIHMVGAHDALNVSEYWDTFYMLGGEELYKNGKPA